MAFLEKQLTIKESDIPGAGKGLFTTAFIPKGTIIVEYKGRITTWKEASANGDSSRYIFHISDDRVIDALTYPKAYARYANDARGLKKIKGLINNSRYIIDDDRVFIESIKDIQPGQEIFVSYGKDYWDTVRQNDKIKD